MNIKHPDDLKTYEYAQPQLVKAVQFREALADGNYYECAADDGNGNSPDCEYNVDGCCTQDPAIEASCVSRRKVFFIYQGNHATDFGYPTLGDYIQYFEDGRRKVWPQEVFEELFRDAMAPLTFGEYDELYEQPYYHYVPGRSDLCGWVIKGEDDYLDYRGAEDVRAIYGIDFMAFRSEESAKRYDSSRK